MKQTARFRKLASIGVVLAMSVVGLSASAASASASKPSGTITFAEGAGAHPNYIFPVVACNYFSVANLNQFQELMYRPLYYFGLGASVAVQPQLSAAALPVASKGNTTYTLNLKGWKFSNGQAIDAQSIAFFLNMYKSFTAPVGGKTPNAGDDCGYNAGYGVPDQIKSVSYPKGPTGNQVVITFTAKENPNWLLYNELGQIQPLPNSWDVTASGPSACATAAYNSATANKDCIAVYNYLNAQSLKTNTWTSKFWQVDSGPWKLTAADALGNVTFVPNTAYSGPQKAQIAVFKEKAYTANAAIEEDLASNSIQLGAVDPTNLPAGAPKPGGLGPNLKTLSANYNLVTGDSWSFNYEAFIFNNNTSAPTKAATTLRNNELSQLYVRQAMQDGVDQAGIISSVFKNYAIPTCSPIPADVPTSIASPINCAYSYSTSKGLKLLTSHGWKLVSGVATCESPGTGSSNCGSGIPKGSTLQFKFSYLNAASSPATADSAQAQIDAWKVEGIQITSDPVPFNTATTICNTVDICSWGAGWIYAPDYYPTGESLFLPATGFNVGDYNNAKMVSLIKGTDFGNTSLDTYGTYAAQQLPVLYVPNPTAIVEVAKNMKGFVNDPLQNFNPEYLTIK
jgi:peptide/nickel transport system substrate-binding protein